MPGGGKGFEVPGPEGQRYRFVLETSRPAPLSDRDKPIQLTHAVLNSPDVEACERFVHRVADDVQFRERSLARLQVDAHVDAGCGSPAFNDT